MFSLYTCSWDRLVATSLLSSTARVTLKSPSLLNRNAHHTHSDGTSRPTPLKPWSRTTRSSLEDHFMTALARAGTCRDHTRHLSGLTSSNINTISHHRTRRKPHQASYSQSTALQADRPSVPPPRKAWDVSKRELKNLVDIYDNVELVDADRSHTVTGSYLSGEIEQDHALYLVPPLDPTVAEVTAKSTNSPILQSEVSPEDAATIEHLKVLLEDERTPNKIVYDAYMRLSYPRARRLPKRLRRGLLHHLSVRERGRNDEESMLKYLSIIDEMRATGVHIPRFTWDTALSYTGRGTDWIVKSDLETVLSIWHEMENEAGTQGNHVTLSILFDIAAKAGRYAFADRIWREMKVRRVEIDRVTRVSQIYAYGLRKDGDRIRTCYNKLVEAGELVDTTVLNCVLTALIKAGEGPAAEEVFERMKAMAISNGKAAQPSNDWREERQIRALLVKLAKQFRGNKVSHRNIQDVVPVAPDRHTYRILLKYNAQTLGNIDRTMELFCEMLDAGISLEYPVFHIIFSGFCSHGGYMYSEWSETRLENSWEAFLAFANNDWRYGEKMDRALATSVVRAFATCIGKERALQVWADIARYWKPTSQTLDSVHSILMSDSFASRATQLSRH